MDDGLDRQAVAKQPTQERAKARFERILAEAEKLLLEDGLEGFSIPLLAERTGFTRGSVYSYFPTPHALLNELAKRNIAELEAAFVEEAAELSRLTWRKAIEHAVGKAVDYNNAHPAARLLLLGGAVTDESFRAQEMTTKRLGDLGRELLRSQGIVLQSRSPDVATVAIDIAVACMRRSVFEHGRITPAYEEAAVFAMTAFLEPHVEAARRKKKESK